MFSGSWLTYIENWPDGLWNALVIVLAIGAGLLLKFTLRRLLFFYNRRVSENFLITAIVDRYQHTTNYFFPLVFLSLALPELRLTLSTFTVVSKLVEVAVTIAFAAVLISTIKVAEDYIYHRNALTKPNNLRERKIRTQIQFIRKFLIMLIVLITFAIVLLSFEGMRKLGAGLLTGVGVGGIIIGFAAQRSLANLLAGFQIAFTQPIRIDDVVIVEGQYGNIEEITLTYVVVRLWDQRRMVLPINYFIEKPFENWTRTSAELLGTIFWHTDLTVPVEPLRTEFLRMIQDHPYWDKRVANFIVSDMKPESMELRALVSAKDSGALFDLRADLREKMWSYIRQNYPDAMVKNRVDLQSSEGSVSDKP